MALGTGPPPGPPVRTRFLDPQGVFVSWPWFKWLLDLYNRNVASPETSRAFTMMVMGG